MQGKESGVDLPLRQAFDACRTLVAQWPPSAIRDVGVVPVRTAADADLDDDFDGDMGGKQRL